MVLKELDGFDRIEACIIHPVVCRTQTGEIVGLIVPSIMVEMRYLEARRDLQTAHGAASEGIGGVYDMPGFSLVPSAHHRWRDN